MDVLLLRLEAPLMSFGGPMVDAHGPTMDFPGQSMICGLLGNALGLDHRDQKALQQLQERLRVAARADCPGSPLEDFQTVALGQDFLVGTGWTTRHVDESRGGASSEGTHIRTRVYWTDCVFTVAVALETGEEAPTLGALAEALQRPARPLFFGRKTCLPAAPIFFKAIQASSLREALQTAPRHPRAKSGALQAWWPADEGVHGGREQSVADLRDWTNNIHTGRRAVCSGMIELLDGAP